MGISRSVQQIKNGSVLQCITASQYHKYHKSLLMFLCSKMLCELREFALLVKYEGKLSTELETLCLKMQSKVLAELEVESQNSDSVKYCKDFNILSSKLKPKTKLELKRLSIGFIN